jgi:hypothetical protein
MKAIKELLENKNYKEALELTDQLELIVKEPEYIEFKEEFDKLKKEVMKSLPLKDKIVKFVMDIYTK